MMMISCHNSLPQLAQLASCSLFTPSAMDASPSTESQDPLLGSRCEFEQIGSLKIDFRDYL